MLTVIQENTFNTCNKTFHIHIICLRAEMSSRSVGEKVVCLHLAVRRRTSTRGHGPAFVSVKPLNTSRRSRDILQLSPGGQNKSFLRDVSCSQVRQH